MTIKKIKTSDILGDNYYIYELTSSNYTPALNGSITITCTMKDVYGTAASGKSITLYQNGTSKGSQITNSSGVATWLITCSTAGLQIFNIKDTSIEVFVDNKEDTSNKVTSLSSSSTDTEYPSAKAVFNSLPSVPNASSATPSADTQDGSVGTGTAWARSDHTHPKSNLYAEASHTHSQYLTSHQDITGKENTSNKLTSLNALDAHSTDTQYASAKLIYEYLETKEDVSNKITSIGSFSTDDEYPSAKCVYDKIEERIDDVFGYMPQDLGGMAYEDNVDGYVGAVALSNDYDDLDNKPTIPTATSDLTNDTGFLTSHQSLTGYLQQSDVKDNLTSTDTNKPLSAKQGKELKTLVDGKASSSHTHNATEIQDSSAHDRIGSGANDNQANINDSIDYALTELDNNILNAKLDLTGSDTFQVKNFINPNNWGNSGCTYSDGVLTFSESNSFTAPFPTDFELSFDYIIDDGLLLGDTIDFEVFGYSIHQYMITEEDIDNGYVIIDVSFKSENSHGIITSEASTDEFTINYVNELNPYTINAITPVGSFTKIANIRYKANNIISLNDNKEDVYNKVTSLSSSSTDTQYPSAKAVKNYVDNLVGSAITYINQ